MPKGWLISEYTGDPYKDYKITFSNAGSLTAASVCTVTVDGAVVAAAAIGTAAGYDLRVTSTSAQLAAGTVIFSADVANKLFHYIIIHKGQK